MNLVDATGTHPVDGLFSFDASGTELAFTPKALFKSSTQYQIKISGLTDRVGHAMAGSIVIIFHSADRILPKVVSIAPADGKVEVAQDAVIRIIFSEPIATPKIENVRLIRIGSAEVLPLQISIADENRLLIAQPSFPLQINQHYEVLVEGITDLSGNPMKKAACVQFATQDTIPPVISSFTRDSKTPPISGQPFRVMASVLDSDLSTIEIALDQAVVGFAQGTGANRELTFTFPFMLAEQPILTAVAIDQVGNRSLTSRIVLVPQDGPPVIVIEGPDIVAPGEAIHLILRSEDSFGLGSVSYTTSGELIQSDLRFITAREDLWAIDFAIPQTAIIGGLFTVSATAVDNGGLTAVATKVFRLRDNKPPMVKIITPPELFFGRTGEIKVHAQDANSPIVSVAIEISGAVELGSNFSLPSDRRDETVTLPLDIPLLKTEGKIITVTAQGMDKAGNRGEAETVSINLVGGAVLGTIFNGTNPIPRVTVWADTGITKEAVTTNAQGQFLLTGLLPGKVNIIAADTGRGMIAAEEVTVLDHGTIAHLDLFLQPGGSILGQVKTAKGLPAGRGVTVKAYTAEGRSFQTLTDNSGLFKFYPLPLTQVYLNAGDADGNQTEQASIRLFEANQKATLQFIPRGTVFGQVVFGDGTTPVAYAQMTLYGSLSAGRTMSADQEGKFSFDRVFAGQFSVTAVDSVLGIRETVTGKLQEEDGTSTNLTIRLTAMGTIKGTVYTVDKKPAVGMMVVLSGAIYRATQTDAEGRFEFKQVPANPYPYSLSASDSGSGDYSETKQVKLLRHGDEVVQDLTLVGFGEVDVYVKSASGAPMAGTKVSLWGNRGQEQVTDSDGLAQFRSITAGQYFVQANLPLYSVYATSLSVAVVAGKRGQVTLTFGKMGTIAGRVLAPDKITPVPGIGVSTQYGNTVLTDSQGHFSFPFLNTAPYTYSLRANRNGRVLAMADSVSLSRDGEVKEVDMVLMPVGTVTGKVFDSLGAPMQYASIQLSFVDPLSRSGQQETMYAYAGPDGSYQAEQIPVGPILIKASSYYGPDLKAEAKGVLRYDQDTLVVNLYLGNNQVELPTSLQTATVMYQLAKDGSYNINELMNRQVRNCACNQLTLTVNGQLAPFPEGRLGKYEQDQQGIGITREGPGGIVVTRKIFAPKRGVVVRALELFTNPTDDPIDLKFEISSLYTSILSTQNGTTTVQSLPGSLMIAGRATTTEMLSSYYYSGGQPVYWRDKAGDESAGTLFGGSVRTGQPFQKNSVPMKSTTYWWGNALDTRTTYGMDAVRVEPGATVGFLHFDFLPWNEVSGETILNRLRGLPPEMLEGLSQEEQDSIINFDLKKDRDSKLTKPVMLSKFSAQVFQKVGTDLIPIPNARVDFQSADPIFPLKHTAMTNAEGVLSLDYQKTDWWSTPPPLPIGAMRIQAFAYIRMNELISTSTVRSEPIITLDQNGELSATLVFTETGAAEVSFERPGGITENVHLTLTHKETGRNYTVANIPSPTSAVTVLALPPGRYQATLKLDHPQITEGIVGYNEFDISASTKTAISIGLETGHLEGTVTKVTGQPAKGVRINLSRPCVYDNKQWCFSGVVYTDQAGGYQFIHLPLGLARLVIQEPGTDLEIAVQIHNARDGKTIRNMVVGVLGDIRVQVIFPNGLPAVHSRVMLDYGKYTGQTDETGKITFSSIPVRNYNVRAFRTENRLSAFFTDQLVLLEKHGEIVDAVLKLPVVANLEVKVADCGGPSAGRKVTLPKAGPYYGVQTTNNDGVVLFENVTQGEYLLSVFNINRWWLGEKEWPVFSTSATVSIDNDNQTVRINAAFCTLPTKITGQVFAADGKTAIPDVSINLTYSTAGQTNGVQTNKDGRFEATSLNEYVGEVKIEVEGFVQTITIGEGGGAITLPPFVLPISVVKVTVSRISRGQIETLSNATLFATSPGVYRVYNEWAKELELNYPRTYRDEHYLFLGLPLGDFEITAHQSDAGQTATRKGRIEAIDQAVEMDILLPPVNDIRILVKNADGTGLKTGRIGIDQVGSPFTILRNLEQGKDGEMILKGMPAGVPLVIAADNGGIISKPEFIVLPDTDQLATITLSFSKRTASVIGQAVAADGVTPLTTSSFVSWGPMLLASTPFGLDRGSVVALDANGRFRFDSLPSGPMHLDVYDSVSQQTGYQTIDLKEGEVLSVTLVADKVTDSSADISVNARLEECPVPGSVSYFFDDYESCLYNHVSLMLGKRSVTDYYDVSTIGSLLSRRFVNMPGSDRGVLSIDQIKNPYPVSITTTVERKKEYSWPWSEGVIYQHPTGGIIVSLSKGERDAVFYHYVFGSSLKNQDHRIVIPAMSCRSVIHLWDISLDANYGSMQGETFLKGVDLLNRFATLDLKSIVPEGDPCPLAQ